MESRAQYIYIEGYGQVEVATFSKHTDGRADIDITSYTEDDAPDTLIGLYRDEAEQLRDALTWALEQFSSPYVIEFTEVVPTEDQLRRVKLAAAIGGKRAVDIDYTNEHGERMWRAVSPHAIDHGILKGWSHRPGSEGFRQYRLGRVHAVVSRPSVAYVGPEGLSS